MPNEDLLAELGLLSRPPGLRARLAAAEAPGNYERPTLEIPPRCLELCTWVVVRAATADRPMVSRLKARNSLCGAEHARAAG